MSDFLGGSILGGTPDPFTKQAPQGIGKQGAEIVKTSASNGGNPVIKTLTVNPDMGSDPLVVEVQTFLDFGIDDGLVTEDLIDRVKNFQDLQGLQITGDLDSATLDAMGIDPTAFSVEENTVEPIGLI